MSFTMTHLIIAENISKIFANHIGSLPQFYVGSIAPDAVHNRADYISDYKKASHLIIGNEKWGMITDNDEWQNNVVAFLHKHKQSENHDFIIGYVCHILADIYNNINVWTPYGQKYNIDINNGYNNLHHIESNKIDIELALTYENRHEIWRHLENSNSVTIPNTIYAAEIDKQKENILNSWYINKERQNISSNTIRTYENEMELIKNTTEFISKILQNIL
jgi:hypothetical protein